MEDENYILIKYDIVKARNFNGGISGTQLILLIRRISLVREPLKTQFQNQKWSTGNT